jgi:hypothetical protein
VHEVSCSWGGFSKGIPNHWVTKGSIYTGIPIDDNDPPTFESEATYLERHGLLTDDEKRILANKPEAWRPEAIDNE